MINIEPFQDKSNNLGFAISQELFPRLDQSLGGVAAYWLSVVLQSERSEVRSSLSGRRVVSLSKIHLPPKKSTGNTQEAVAPSPHD